MRQHFYFLPVCLSSIWWPLGLVRSDTVSTYRPTELTQLPSHGRSQTSPLVSPHSHCYHLTSHILLPIKHMIDPAGSGMAPCPVSTCIRQRRLSGVRPGRSLLCSLLSGWKVNKISQSLSQDQYWEILPSSISLRSCQDNPYHSKDRPAFIC